MCNILRKYFAWFGGLDPKSRPFLIYPSNATNEKPVMTSFWFLIILKLCTNIFKNSFTVS